MSIFEYTPEELLGTVESVDTSTVIVKVENDDKLRGLQVNHLISIQSSKIGQHLIGLVSKIIRKSAYSDSTADLTPELGFNIIKVILIGTHFDREAGKENVFRRSLATIPTINAECHLIHGDRLKRFMQAISSIPEGEDAVSLQIGNYSIDEDATAWLNGNKLFQRHAVIVGSTGSGKSWCVAKILEQVAALKSADAILFDIHGEYSSLQGDNFTHLKVAGPNDAIEEGMLFLPYWLLTYEEMLSLMLDRSDNNAPNQAMMFSSAVIDGKKEFLRNANKAEMEANITLDSPVPYSLDDLLAFLKSKDTEMVSGARSEKQGPYFGKLTRFIQRLETKQKDKRLNFMFASEKRLLNYDYMSELCSKLMLPSIAGKKGVKIIDFSEVPSDILTLIVSLIARVIFSVQQWTNSAHRHPIALFCDEAHLYIPANTEKSIDDASLVTFERISKEGRKYGIGLVVISQRPSEVNRTVLSQSNNFIAMRLTNVDDQAVVKRLLPDSLGDYAEMLPILDIGEALVVGDASLLPSRIRVTPPDMKPRSATIDFWDEWSKESPSVDIDSAVEALRKQSK
ncbi:MAG: ATP-binding protein [Phascolarctobacterium sp.]|uniref:ATP-binding protein n=1 Tax=Phascolarctobacterium sp. TaxID=2049039 RepID=UPI0026DB9DA1|nr:ATP-binding protein [Phascolarctobacterium sp.]MDO4921352.1 ATP-binding protein [Phascolarctobacterium sp.]